MGKYSILNELPEPDPSLRVNDLYVTASLEVVLRDSGGDGIVLRLHSYPASVNNVGYWAPPNLQYKVNKHGDAPRGSEAILAMFERHQSESFINSTQEEIRLLAESFGLRGAEVKPVGHLLVEAKPSINDPARINAFSTIRFALTYVEPESHANLVDPEGRHGFIVLPLPARASDPRIRMGEDLSGTGELCRFFLGKPVMSGLNTLLERGDVVRQMRGNAIDVSHVGKFRLQHGLLVAADIAGYGEALVATLMGLLGDPEVERSRYRRRVLGVLESALTATGTTQVQSAGDGFVAGYPCSQGAKMMRETLDRIISSWTTTVRAITHEINPLLTRTQELPGLGSRMAVDSGVYEWGRINGIDSFFPAFEGAAVITAARLEQALRQGMIDKELEMEGGRMVTMNKQGHYLALSSEIAQSAGIDNGSKLGHGWEMIGRCKLQAKELQRENVVLFAWNPEADTTDQIEQHR